jgi:NAD-dependent SIR2 family protein deacetylase
MTEKDLDNPAKIVELVVKSERVDVFSGADINAESGITDFRGQGLSR